MASQRQKQLIEFLQTELAVSSEAIAMGLRKAGQATNLLPMALWQYGLVSTDQLSQIFDWLEEFGPAT
ncbi:DUF2949 domain-containing protein [Leptolyngbya sp. CCNP1308]|uniref:DUF2949 domain-containing protein n=1 Tax=Leptolyngbya sp. CCNP1308 TaxID=3110255 RepID=UPI002B1F7596|nr:DUF2949 domain-containing protein [Leptolyngbya sp. CCNP1308]MEA5447253.1 DUF2949 domain-containing protein [Leptolyngbya sp. CCNP1308]